MTTLLKAVTLENMNDAVNKIRKLIFNLYKCVFRGRLEIVKNSSGYSLILGIPSNDKPTTINIDGTLEDFYKGIEQEFKINKKYVADFKRVDLITYD